jgi:type I restriction enzyme S subunit
MVVRARLSAPRIERDRWPWHHAKWTALPASLLAAGERRMEAENYLSGGYGLRVALQARKSGRTPLSALAKVWQPSRLKGIQVAREFGTPFLAATQVFDQRPFPRKFLALERIDNHAARFVAPGTILVTCSGSVGRATLAHRPHEGVLISHDLLRVEARDSKYWGWLYAYLRAPQTRAMMTASQYGHVIKHLEVGHLDALPVPVPRDDLLAEFDRAARTILDARNRGHALRIQAESEFEKHADVDSTESYVSDTFAVSTQALTEGRRRFDASFHHPRVTAIRARFARRKLKSARITDLGLDVWLPNRFRREPAEDGVELLDSSDLFEVTPDVTKRIADGDFGDRNRGRVEPGWLLLARSGQVYGLNGSLALATQALTGRVVSDHVIRIAPTTAQSVALPYLFIALSHPSLGQPLVKALAYGSSVPEIEVQDVKELPVVRLSEAAERAVAELAQTGSSAHADADQMERELGNRAGALIDRFIAGDTTGFALTPAAAGTGG